MGAIWSRLKKKESTKEILKKIQEDINSLEEYKEYTEQRRKKLVGSLIAYSIFFYLVAALICYFYYLPPTLEERLLYATPFAGFIVLIYLLKSILTSYYRWKVRRNENKLVQLKEKKEDILDQVMETETYKVAKDILETFAPEQIRKASLTLKSPVTSSAISSQRRSLPQGGEIRRRIISPSPQNFASARPTPSSVRPSSSFPYARPHITPHLQKGVIRPSYEGGPGGGRGGGIHAVNNHGGDLPGASSPPGPPMPRPILPRERGMLDRFVEYLVGDGPSNRYALVCRQCESHNGMALKDEFPYIAFRCAYCYYWNPARKQKPAPPRLENVAPRISADMSRRLLAKEEEESSSSDDEEDDDEESESESTSASNLSSDEKETHEEKFTNKTSLLGQGDTESKLRSKPEVKGLGTEVNEQMRELLQKSESEVSEKTAEPSSSELERESTEATAAEQTEETPKPL